MLRQSIVESFAAYLKSLYANISDNSFNYFGTIMPSSVINLMSEEVIATATINGKMTCSPDITSGLFVKDCDILNMLQSE